MGKGEAVLGLAQSLHEEITPIDDLRSSSSFRRVAAENLLRSFLQGMASG
ncbi:MAG: hypothetical protein KGQ59_10680 [Bdellovibrionales bacterium]|nr:hypothetical protein [Bdellovibrionales bacterium]